MGSNKNVSKSLQSYTKTDAKKIRLGEHYWEECGLKVTPQGQPQHHFIAVLS